MSRPMKMTPFLIKLIKEKINVKNKIYLFSRNNSNSSNYNNVNYKLTQNKYNNSKII